MLDESLQELHMLRGEGPELGQGLTQSVWWMSRMILQFSSSWATTSDLHRQHAVDCQQALHTVEEFLIERS